MEQDKERREDGEEEARDGDARWLRGRREKSKDAGGGTGWQKVKGYRTEN